MVLLLGGGGDMTDERPVLDRFVGLVGARPITYWPFALDLDSYESATALTEVALGWPVETWNSLDDRSHRDLPGVRGVFIGGRNTYHLLNEVRRAHLGGILRERARTGVVYGGSAGAIIFGSDIGTAGFFDPNDVGLTNTRGLGILGSHAVWCHYEDGHTDDLRAWTRASGCPVIVLTERSGAEVTDGILSAIGHESVLLSTPDGRFEEVPRGASRRLG